jgi:DnaJ-class molecular chaperone
VDRELLAGWLRALDGLTHYTLLGVRPDAGPDELKVAFHVFADTFHPDAHVGRPPAERDAIGRIFRRGSEAYRVLEDPTLRAQYDAQLAQGASAQQASRYSQLPPRMTIRPGPKKLEDALRSPMARPFARRAEELVKAGDYKQAKLQATMARHYEQGNPELEAFLKGIEEKIRGGK